MKQSFALLLVLFQAVTIAAQTTNRFPINRGLLQSDLDGNGLVITNVHISGSVTGIVSAASGSVISNSSLFGGLSFANGAYFGIDQQQVFGGGGPNGGGIRIVDGDLGGEVSIEGGTNYGHFYGDGSGLTNLPSSGSGIPTLNGIGTNTALTNFVYLLGTNMFAQSNNGSYLWVTNTATFANNIARVTSGGVYQSDPGSTLTVGTGHNFIAGDNGNAVGSSGDYHSIAGGIANTITPTIGSDDLISGGQANRIRGGTPSSVSHSSLLGGIGNLIETNSGAATECAVILGGRSNYVNQSYGLAAGLFANAIHQGASVFADSVGGTFSSVGNDTFNIKTKSLFATNDDAAGHWMYFSNGVLYAVLHSGNGNQLTNTGLTVTTNSTAPANTSTIRAWMNVTNDSGKVGKIPVYY